MIAREFMVAEGRETDFEKVFGPDGIWPEFLRRSEGFLTTEIQVESVVERRYRLWDYWRSHEDFNWFREMFQREYERFTQLVTDEGIIERQRVVGSFYIDDSDLGLVST